MIWNLMMRCILNWLIRTKNKQKFTAYEWMNENGHLIFFFFLFCLTAIFDFEFFPLFFIQIFVFLLCNGLCCVYILLTFHYFEIKLCAFTWIKSSFLFFVFHSLLYCLWSYSVLISSFFSLLVYFADILFEFCFFYFLHWAECAICIVFVIKNLSEPSYFCTSCMYFYYFICVEFVFSFLYLFCFCFYK